MKPNEALKAYNRVTNRLITGPYGKGSPLQHTQKNHDRLKLILSWCLEHGIEFEAFVRARHEAIGWKRRIPLRQLIEIGDNFLEKYHEWMQPPLIQEQRDRQRIEDDVDRELEITPLTEAMKVTYGSDRQLCLAMSLGGGLTGGWNPKSEHCRECSEALMCCSILPARIQAKRCREHPSLVPSSNGS